MAEGGENRVIEAVGPEAYTFRGLFAMLGEAIGVKRPVLSVPPWCAFAAAQGDGGVPSRCDADKGRDTWIDGGQAVC